MTFTDTVGFIYDIPHVLIDSFLSTLEEINFTDCILLMIDISEKDIVKLKQKIDTSISTIRNIGAEDVPIIYVFNKSDLLEKDVLDHKIKLVNSFFPPRSHAVISSKEKNGFNDLLHQLVIIKKKLGYP
jgi:GTP-binding protein HflX